MLSLSSNLSNDYLFASNDYLFASKHTIVLGDGSVFPSLIHVSWSLSCWAWPLSIWNVKICHRSFCSELQTYRKLGNLLFLHSPMSAMVCNWELFYPSRFSTGGSWFFKLSSVSLSLTYPPLLPILSIPSIHPSIFIITTIIFPSLYFSHFIYTFVSLSKASCSISFCSVISYSVVFSANTIGLWGGRGKSLVSFLINNFFFFSVSEPICLLNVWMLGCS